jgi:hypothetical protein
MTATPQRHSALETLEMGGRYLDLRVSALRSDPTVVLLAHSFLSGITLNATLADINSFLTANPGEILILDIVNDYDPNGIVGQPVPNQQLEAIVRQYISPQFILSRANLTHAISTYGGAYITGFSGNNTLSQPVIKAGWSLTQGAYPLQVVQNIQNYYVNGTYKT